MKVINRPKISPTQLGGTPRCARAAGGRRLAPFVFVFLNGVSHCKTRLDEFWQKNHRALVQAMYLSYVGKKIFRHNPFCQHSFLMTPSSNRNRQ